MKMVNARAIPILLVKVMGFFHLLLLKYTKYDIVIQYITIFYTESRGVFSLAKRVKKYVNQFLSRAEWIFFYTYYVCGKNEIFGLPFYSFAIQWRKKWFLFMTLMAFFPSMQQWHLSSLKILMRNAGISSIVEPITIVINFHFIQGVHVQP